ncbi:thiamine phosphate synthase [Trinickia sp. EG282A]|uniref:thiamine phosphate synthase n=1 Tax=Trinickia sp. EG282A TaxID=3237013 RepID=UPI0034D29B8C
MRIETDLPELLLITPEPEPDADGRFGRFLDRLDRALARGIALVQLRAKRLDAARFDELAAQALILSHGRGARLIVNGPRGHAAIVAAPNPASGLEPTGHGGGVAGADGFHLTSEQLMKCSARLLSDAKLLSAACHTEEQLARAERVGVDFVTLSPVLPTASHPGAATLGWERFGECVGRARVPVYALGGMTREHCAKARSLGAQGIASITGLW